PGASRVATAAASMARADDTSARSTRLKRHFDMNARRRSPASRAWTPVQPCSSACNAAAAASSPPWTAKRSPSPVIGSMNPAASPAKSSPSILVCGDSTASGPRTTGGATSRASAKRSRSCESAANARVSSPAGSASAVSPAPDGRTRHTFVKPPGTGATPTTARLVDRRAPDGDSGLVLAPGGDRLPEEDPVEIAPHDGAPRLSARVAAVDDVAALASDAHAVDTKPARVEVAVDAETP